jgi:hypothetical protein
MTNSDAYGSTFAVFPKAQSQQKNCKRVTNPTHNNSTTDSQTTTEKKGEGITAVLQKWRCSAPYDSEVGNQILMLRLKFCGENRYLRVAANR